jgi:Ser/Thr protein kinase RdoA (MazF antagonist)
MEPVTYSPLGRQWSLTTAQGRWLALPGYPWMNDDHAETGERLRLAVSADEVPSPAFRRSGAGRLIESVAGDPWRVAAWQDLGPVPSLPARAAVARRAGEIAGALHSLAIPSDEPIHPYLTWRHSADDWQELLRRARTAGRPWADRLAALLPVVAELGALGAAVPTEGLLLCNCNLLPENVRQGPGEELVVVDWAFTGSLTAEYEVASLLTHWGLRPELNRVAAKAFATGYAERAGRFPELSRDSFGLAITSHLNWTYNAFCEAISPADPDAADHAEREVADLLPRPWTPALLDQVISAAIP